MSTSGRALGTHTQALGLASEAAWQAQHFGEVGCRFRGRRSTFARSTFLKD